MPVEIISSPEAYWQISESGACLLIIEDICSLIFLSSSHTAIFIHKILSRGHFPLSLLYRFPAKHNSLTCSERRFFCSEILFSTKKARSHRLITDNHGHTLKTILNSLRIIQRNETSTALKPSPSSLRALCSLLHQSYPTHLFSSYKKDQFPFP